MESIKFLTAKERKELFDRIENDTRRHAARNKAIFYLGKYCALRASELSLLRLDEYDPINHTIVCHRLKSGRDNTLRIVDNNVVSSLQNYIDFYPVSEILFRSQQQQPISRKSLDLIMKQYCMGTSIPPEKQHFHVLRHTRAIEILEATGNVFDVQYWLGHRNIQNTMIYLQFTTKQHEHLYNSLKKMEVSK